MKDKMQKVKIIGFVAPLNFAHRSGDGTKTRNHTLTEILPSLQANCGNSQRTYVLELWSEK